MSFDKISSAAIERCPHDKENPYAQISRNLIRDKNISPGCRMILIHLLSNDEKSWVIRPRQIHEAFKPYFGRDKILKLLNEAIAAGYMKRVTYVEIVNGKSLLRYKYYLSEMPKFKKSLQQPCFQGTEAQGTKDQGTLEEQYEKKENLKKDNPPLSSPPKPKPKKEKNISLRSEEEEFHACLKDTTLSPKEKLRLTKDFTAEQVSKALELSRGQTIKKTLMHLLLNILQNPDKWERSEAKEVSPAKQLALAYNEKLKEVSAEVHKTNKVLIDKGSMYLIERIVGGDIEWAKVSLASDYFSQDIKTAMKYLDAYEP